ncbi:dihydrofolate reductase family protein [Wenxinia saemankumensis]|uniref:Dihydrofolate reductase n=1 Tax=Wenxinia saemankumensis TaxID=1447782 RepID=A0A1M6G8I5_9RHOB|nr:dihydrofolate reductase family protein [Wenxinia saemankumensis]SHJ06283.1 Dihydrofolate reductase [Wenxinia saemankumensis]
MATLFYGMNVSLDGHVDHDAFAPGPGLFRHFIEQTAGLAGSLYGRGLYGIMRYWDEDRADWGPDERAFAAAWRAVPKWVASATLEEVGPNATLLGGDAVAAARRLKAERKGGIEVGGTVLARALGEAGLIDEIRLYLHPVVTGGGTPFFAGWSPQLRLLSHEEMPGGVVLLRYAPS